jgi:hypothetical protein
VLTEICISPFDGGHFNNLHSGLLLSCCTLIIAHFSRFVNTFFEKTFFILPIDKFDFLCYNVYSGREGAYMRGPYSNICSHYTAPGQIRRDEGSPFYIYKSARARPIIEHMF